MQFQKTHSQVPSAPTNASQNRLCLNWFSQTQIIGKYYRITMIDESRSKNLSKKAHTSLARTIITSNNQAKLNS